MLGDDITKKKIRDAYCRLGVAEGILNSNRNLIRSSTWTRSNVDRIKLIEDIKEQLKKEG